MGLLRDYLGCFTVKLPNKDYLRACMWDIEHDTYADVSYPPAPRTYSIWTHADPEIQAAFEAYFAPPAAQ